MAQSGIGLYEEFCVRNLILFNEYLLIYNVMVFGVLESECNRLWRHDIRTDVFEDRVAFPATLSFDCVDIHVL